MSQRDDAPKGEAIGLKSEQEFLEFLEHTLSPPDNRQPDVLRALAAIHTMRGVLSRSPRSEIAPQWIPVGERVPDPYATVLLNCAGELLSTGYFGSAGKFHVDAEDLSDGSAWIVTHWMPLPNAAGQVSGTPCERVSTDARVEPAPAAPTALNPAAAWPFPPRERSG